MGGIQGREGAIAEVHAVRGGQLILRVASSQMSNSSGNNNCSGGPLGTPGSGRTNFIISTSASSGDGRCYILEQSMDVLEKIFLR